MPYLVTLLLAAVLCAATFALSAWIGDGDFVAAFFPMLILLAAGAGWRAHGLRRRKARGRELVAHFGLALLGAALGGLADGLAFEWLRAGGPEGLGAFPEGFRAMGYGTALALFPLGFGFLFGTGWAAIQERDDDPGEDL